MYVLQAVDQGVHYYEADVIGCDMALDSTAGSNYRINSVQCSNDISITGGTFVNATGAWSGSLIDQFARSNNIKNISSLPVKARKRNIFVVHCPSSHTSNTGTGAGAGADESNVHHPIPHDKSPLTIDPTGVYFRPEGSGGNFICGVSPGSGDPDPDLGGAADLWCPDNSLFEDRIWPVLCDRVPAFERLKVKSSWAGYYEVNTLDEVRALLPFACIVGVECLCNMALYHLLERCYRVSSRNIKHGIVLRILRARINVSISYDIHSQHFTFSKTIYCGFLHVIICQICVRQSPGAGRAVTELIEDGKFSTIDLQRLSFDRVAQNKPLFETGIV